MTGDGGTLESLDLDDHILQKLEGVGIQSISNLATTTTSEFLESYYSSYDEGVIRLEKLSFLDVFVNGLFQLYVRFLHYQPYGNQIVTSDLFRDPSERGNIDYLGTVVVV